MSANKSHLSLPRLLVPRTRLKNLLKSIPSDHMSFIDYNTHCLKSRGPYVRKERACEGSNVILYLEWIRFNKKSFYVNFGFSFCNVTYWWGVVFFVSIRQEPELYIHLWGSLVLLQFPRIIASSFRTSPAALEVRFLGTGERLSILWNSEWSYNLNGNHFFWYPK